MFFLPNFKVDIDKYMQVYGLKNCIQFSNVIKIIINKV